MYSILPAFIERFPRTHTKLPVKLYISIVLLVLISLGLIVAVPVALATPGEWEGAKNNFNNAFAAWVGLVLVIAAVDGVSSSI